MRKECYTTKYNKYLFLLILSTILGGCALSTVVPQERYFWPSPPNPPRIEWLGAYSSQLDLKMTEARRIKEFIVGQDAPITLKKPVEVRFDQVLDKFYVADAEAGGVYVFDLGRSEIRMLSTADSPLPEAITPVALAIDKDSNLYVLEPRLRKILVFSSSEKYLRSFSIAEICRRPVAIAIDKNRGRLYVSDVQLNKIFVIDLYGKRLFDFGKPGDGGGAFNRPVGVAIGSGGDIIVADSFNARVQIFTESGRFLRAFGRRGDSVGDFQLIKSVAVDPDDNIYVVDGRLNTINIFNQVGDLLMSLGAYYAVSTSGKLAPGGFLLPVSIDIDSRGKIFIVDQLNARIQSFQYIPEKIPTPLIPVSGQAK